VQVLLKGGGKGQELSLREAGRGVYARAHHLEYKWDGHTCIHFNSIYIYIYKQLHPFLPSHSRSHSKPCAKAKRKHQGRKLEWITRLKW
jgi:hypothetical protein